MLGARLKAAALLITLLVVVMWLDAHYNFRRPGVWLVPVAVVFSAVATYELIALIAANPHLAARPHVLWTLVAVQLVVACALVPTVGMPAAVRSVPVQLSWVLAGWLTALTLLLVVEIRDFPGHRPVLARLAVSAFIVAYVGVLTAFLGLLRCPGSQPCSLIPLVATIAVVKVGDSAAYFTGRTWGRGKLAPAVSPNKTITGLVGGLAGSILCAALVRALIHAPASNESQPLAYLVWVAFGLTVGLAGVVGDLAESLIKRDLGAKDSGHWLPGLGGVLDVMDSLLMAAPISYLWWASGALAP